MKKKVKLQKYLKNTRTKYEFTILTKKYDEQTPQLKSKEQKDAKKSH